QQPNSTRQRLATPAGARGHPNGGQHRSSEGRAGPGSNGLALFRLDGYSHRDYEGRRSCTLCSLATKIVACTTHVAKHRASTMVQASKTLACTCIPQTKS